MIAVATSIPPRLLRQDAGRSIDDGYQQLCIRSWIDSGFRILSVNDRDEIPDLAGRYPEVEFVATDRNASAWSGRKNPYIADLLLALQNAPEPVLGIINADLLFEPSPEWQMRLPSLVGQAIVVAHRYDTDSLLGGAFRRYYDGFDCFFFDRALARKALEHAMPFAMGLPWWDIWLPCVGEFNNRRILVVDRPSVVHLLHKQAYPAAVVWEFAHKFANIVVKQSELGSHGLPKFVLSLVPACREIAALPYKDDAESEEYRRTISKLGSLFIPATRQNAVCWSSNTLARSVSNSSASGPLDPSASFGAPLTVHDVFRCFDLRFAAGTAFLRGIRQLKENRLAEAESELLSALHTTPNDFGVLRKLGEVAFRRGDFQTAHTLFNKAAEQQPNNTQLMKQLGAVLRATNRRAEAIECFQEILDIDPTYQSVYTDIAIVLWETGRGREALCYLEHAIKLWPQYTRAIELYDRFHKDFDAHSAIRPRAGQGSRRLAYSYMVRLIHRVYGSVSRTANWPNRVSRGGKTDEKSVN
jgi:tetratricopeptide (TPR) repeat protein